MAYGFNAADQFKRAAVYASRILKGEKAGDLPVQGPSLFEFGINLRDRQGDGADRAATAADRRRRDRRVGRRAAAAVRHASQAAPVLKYWVG